MSEEAVKLEKDLCRCCHSEGAFMSIYAQHFWLNNEGVMEEVVFSDMLRECFGIEIVAVAELLTHTFGTICNACIQRLGDATNFKRLVQDSERTFQEQYVEHIGKDNEDLKVNVYCDKGLKEWDTDTVADDGSMTDDDFLATGYGDDGDYKLEVHNVTQVNKETQRKKTRTASSKVKIKRKVGRPKKNVPKDEETEQNVKRPPRVVLKDGVDFKFKRKIFQCCRCEHKCKTKDGIRYHIRKFHFNIPRFSCRHCPKTFSSLPSFVDHKMIEHNVDDRHKCKACDKVFNSRNQMRNHTKSFHMLGEKLKCELCEFETFIKRQLKSHKSKHESAKNYHCKYCQKSFKRKRTVQCHERIHTGDKRKVCQECGQAFVQKASLNYHMTKYHPEVNF